MNEDGRCVNVEGSRLWRPSCLSGSHKDGRQGEGGGEMGVGEGGVG